MGIQDDTNFFSIILVSGLCVMVDLLKYWFDIKSHVKIQELDSIIFLGPFPAGIFYDSMSVNHYHLIRKDKNNQQRIYCSTIYFPCMLANLL